MGDDYKAHSHDRLRLLTLLSTVGLSRVLDRLRRLSRWHSFEHWMMAAKARLFNDAASLEQTSVASTPAEAKALERQIKYFDDAIWKANARRLSKCTSFLRSTPPQ